MNNMNHVKAVFFDADDTLLDHKACEKQALVHVFDSIGVDYQAQYQDLFRHFEQVLFDEGAYNGIAVPKTNVFTYRFKLLFEKLNIPYNDYVKANGFFKTGLANSAALIDGAVEVVEYLHRKGYLLCVATNGLIELQCSRVMNSEIGTFISHIMASEEAGAHKPDPLIFYMLLERIGLQPGDVIMVGDSITNDIQGAKNAGITAVWYNPQRRANPTGIVPDFEIANLPELKNML